MLIQDDLQQSLNRQEEPTFSMFRIALDWIPKYFIVERDIWKGPGVFLSP